MQGKISDQDGFLLDDLLQILCKCKKDGCLRLEDKASGQKALITIRDGKILNATSKTDKGIEVINEFAAKKRLDFTLQEEIRDPEDRIQKSLNDILSQLDQGVLMAAGSDSSPHTYYTLVKGAPHASGGTSEQDNANFKDDTDFIQYHSTRVGETLNMSVLSDAAVCGAYEKLAMKYAGGEIRGVHTRQALNIEKVMDLL